MNAVHEHLCQDSADKTAEICRARGYCKCDCGMVRTERLGWVTLEAAFADAKDTSVIVGVKRA